jgi:hypothetical protein
MDVSGFRERPHHLVDILWLASRFDGKRVIRHVAGSTTQPTAETTRNPGPGGFCTGDDDIRIGGAMGQDIALRSRGHPSCASGVDFIAQGHGTVVFRFCRYQR